MSHWNRRHKAELIVMLALPIALMAFDYLTGANFRESAIARDRILIGLMFWMGWAVSLTWRTQ